MSPDPPPVPEPLLDLVRAGGRHLWVGDHPPFPADAVALFGCTNLRAAAGLHQAYDTVWCYETPLVGWEANRYLLVIDELVRFVGAAGTLVLRYGAQHGVIPVKLTLGRRLGLTARVTHEETDPVGVVTTVFALTRAAVGLYRPAPWTFGILTQNTRKPNVVAFLKSVRDHDPDRRHEVIICGPPDPDYAFADPVYLPQNYSAERAEITRKKNDIGRAATRPNLLIVHDRYVLADNFFAGFDQYGYDFDFVTIDQRYPDGEEFPGYCTIVDGGLAVTPSRAIEDAANLPGTPYLNGGLFAVKTHVFRAVPMNELSYWNQAEDVEYTVAVMRHGLAPRLNPYSSATTLGIDRQYTKAFRPADPVYDSLGLAVADLLPVPRPWAGYRAARHVYHLARRRQKLLAAAAVLILMALQLLTLVIVAAGRVVP